MLFRSITAVLCSVATVQPTIPPLSPLSKPDATLALRQEMVPVIEHISKANPEDQTKHSDNRPAGGETVQPTNPSENENSKCDFMNGVGSGSGENGISVGGTKVFDNRTLTLMLETLSDTLRGLQVVDQDPLKKALGLLQGSQTQDVSRSLSILAGGMPKIETTETSSTQTDTERQRTLANGTKDDKVMKDYVQALVDQKVSEKLGTNRVTTTSERNPSIPTLPDLISAPTGAPAFGQNPVDLLTDQVNLTYQIFNVRMLLERSLTDRLLDDNNPRLQTVLGFNVSIDPPRDAEQSAALVEITIESIDKKPVSLVAMMPQEKTYNSVALSTKSNAFGGSAVIKMVTVGYSERRRGQIFYLFRDNDTLSFERMTKDGGLTFGWEFRPVLGRKAVAPGMRQMFAVISMPVSDAARLAESKDLRVSARTYWRKYYPATLTSANRGEIGIWPHVKRALSLGTSYPVPNGNVACRHKEQTTALVPTTTKYQDALTPKIAAVKWTQLDEKNALVSVSGDNFFTGTTVALGGPTSSTNVVIKSTQALDILTPIENIGAGDAMVIGRYGTAQLLATNSTCSLALLPGGRLSLPFGGQRELDLLLDLKLCPISSIDQQLVVFANGKRVPGRPHIFQDGENLRLVTSVPTDLFPKTEGVITVVNPFRTNSPRVQFQWYENPYEVRRISGGGKTIVYIRRPDGLSLLSQDAFGKDPRWKVQFAGQTISHTFLSPYLMQVEIPSPDATGSLALLEPVLGKPSDSNLILLELPSIQPKPKVPIEPASGTTLILNQNDVAKLDFSGENIADVSKVLVEGKNPLKQEYDPGKKILSVYLTQDITKSVARVTLQFRDSAGKLLAALVLNIRTRDKTD